MEENTQKMNFFQRLKIAIFKLEDYGTFLGERVFTALKYFFILILLVSVVIPIVATYQFSDMANRFLNYVENELPDFTYENGEINFPQKVNAYDNDFDFAFIADTGEILDDKIISQYKNEIGEYGLILLKNKAIFVSNGMELEEEYVKLFDQNELDIKNKSDLINQLSQINLGTVLGTYFIVCYITNYIVKIIYIFFDVCSIAIFGWIAAKLCGINFKVEPIFSLSIYSISLSVILNAIYECIVNITGFEIEYFDIICLLISYIYIIAAIFMIKYDLIKQTEELQKILEVQKQVKRDGELDSLSNNDKKDKDEPNKKDDKKQEKNENTNDNESVDEPVIENKEPDGSEI